MAARGGRNGDGDCMRALTLLVLVGILGACAPRGPDSAGGFGMGDYGRHMQTADARRPDNRAIAAEAVATVRPGDAPAAATSASLTRDDVLDMDTARATRDAEQAAFEARRASFQPVAPTALPERPTDTPNIVDFALRTSHGVGQQRYRRSRLTVQNHARNCGEFTSADRAQEEFLRLGGPERDPRNLDPDGDGFACSWSPEPFRAAARTRD